MNRKVAVLVLAVLLLPFVQLCFSNTISGYVDKTPVLEITSQRISEPFETSQDVRRITIIGYVVRQQGYRQVTDIQPYSTNEQPLSGSPTSLTEVTQTGELTDYSQSQVYSSLIPLANQKIVVVITDTDAAGDFIASSIENNHYLGPDGMKEFEFDMSDVSFASSGAVCRTYAVGYSGGTVQLNDVNGNPLPPIEVGPFMSGSESEIQVCARSQETSLIPIGTILEAWFAKDPVTAYGGCFAISLIMGVIFSAMFYSGMNPIRFWDINNPRLPKIKMRKVGRLAMMGGYHETAKKIRKTLANSLVEARNARRRVGKQIEEVEQKIRDTRNRFAGAAENYDLIRALKDELAHHKNRLQALESLKKAIHSNELWLASLFYETHGGRLLLWKLSKKNKVNYLKLIKQSKKGDAAIKNQIKDAEAVYLLEQEASNAIASLNHSLNRLEAIHGTGTTNEAGFTDIKQTESSSALKEADDKRRKICEIQEKARKGKHDEMRDEMDELFQHDRGGKKVGENGVSEDASGARNLTAALERAAETKKMLARLSESNLNKAAALEEVAIAEMVAHSMVKTSEFLRGVSQHAFDYAGGSKNAIELYDSWLGMLTFQMPIFGKAMEGFAYYSIWSMGTGALAEATFRKIALYPFMTGRVLFSVMRGNAGPGKIPNPSGKEKHQLNLWEATKTVWQNEWSNTNYLSFSLGRVQDIEREARFNYLDVARFAQEQVLARILIELQQNTHTDAASAVRLAENLMYEKKSVSYIAERLQVEYEKVFANEILKNLLDLTTSIKTNHLSTSLKGVNGEVLTERILGLLNELRENSAFGHDESFNKMWVNLKRMNEQSAAFGLHAFNQDQVTTKKKMAEAIAEMSEMFYKEGDFKGIRAEQGKLDQLTELKKKAELASRKVKNESNAQELARQVAELELQISEVQNRIAERTSMMGEHFLKAFAEHNMAGMKDNDKQSITFDDRLKILQTLIGGIYLEAYLSGVTASPTRHLGSDGTYKDKMDIRGFVEGGRSSSGILNGINFFAGDIVRKSMADMGRGSKLKLMPSRRGQAEDYYSMLSRKVTTEFMSFLEGYSNSKVLGTLVLGEEANKMDKLREAARQLGLDKTSDLKNVSVDVFMRSRTPWVANLNGYFAPSLDAAVAVQDETTGKWKLVRDPVKMIELMKSKAKVMRLDTHTSHNEVLVNGGVVVEVIGTTTTNGSQHSVPVIFHGSQQTQETFSRNLVDVLVKEFSMNKETVLQYFKSREGSMLLHGGLPGNPSDQIGSPNGYLITVPDNSPTGQQFSLHMRTAHQREMLELVSTEGTGRGVSGPAQGLLSMFTTLSLASIGAANIAMLGFSTLYGHERYLDPTAPSGMPRFAIYSEIKRLHTINARSVSAGGLDQLNADMKTNRDLIELYRGRLYELRRDKVRDEEELTAAKDKLQEAQEELLKASREANLALGKYGKFDFSSYLTEYEHKSNFFERLGSGVLNTLGYHAMSALNGLNFYATGGYLSSGLRFGSQRSRDMVDAYNFMSSSTAVYNSIQTLAMRERYHGTFDPTMIHDYALYRTKGPSGFWDPEQKSPFVRIGDMKYAHNDTNWYHQAMEVRNHSWVQAVGMYDWMRKMLYPGHRMAEYMAQLQKPFIKAQMHWGTTFDDVDERVSNYSIWSLITDVAKTPMQFLSAPAYMVGPVSPSAIVSSMAGAIRPSYANYETDLGIGKFRTGSQFHSWAYDVGHDHHTGYDKSIWSEYGILADDPYTHKSLWEKSRDSAKYYLAGARKPELQGRTGYSEFYFELPSAPNDFMHASNRAINDLTPGRDYVDMYGNEHNSGRVSHSLYNTSNQLYSDTFRDAYDPMWWRPRTGSAALGYSITGGRYFDLHSPMNEYFQRGTLLALLSPVNIFGVNVMGSHVAYKAITNRGKDVWNEALAPAYKTVRNLAMYADPDYRAASREARRQARNLIDPVKGQRIICPGCGNSMAVGGSCSTCIGRNLQDNLYRRDESGNRPKDNLKRDRRSKNYASYNAAVDEIARRAIGLLPSRGEPEPSRDSGRGDIWDDPSMVDGYTGLDRYTASSARTKRRRKMERDRRTRQP